VQLFSISDILFAPDPVEFYLDIVDEAEENYLYEEDIIPLILVYQKNPSIVNSILSIYHQQHPATATEEDREEVRKDGYTEAYEIHSLSNDLATARNFSLHLENLTEFLNWLDKKHKQDRKLKKKKWAEKRSEMKWLGNADLLNDLCHDLLLKGFLKSGTSQDAFGSVFNGGRIQQPLHWEGKTSQLLYMIMQLVQADLLQESSGKRNEDIVTSFRVRDRQISIKTVETYRKRTRPTTHTRAIKEIIDTVIKQS